MRRRRVPGEQRGRREQAQERAGAPEPRAPSPEPRSRRLLGSGSLCVGCAERWAGGTFVSPSLQTAAGRSRSPGNMRRTWILLTLGLVAYVSAESVSGPGRGRARWLGCPGLREQLTGYRGAPPGDPRGRAPRSVPGICWDKCARFCTPSPSSVTFPQKSARCRRFPADPRRWGTASQFLYLQRPRSYPQFRRPRGILLSGARRTEGKGCRAPGCGPPGIECTPRAAAATWKLWGPSPLSSSSAGLNAGSRLMGPRFKKPASVRKGKFGKVLLFDSPRGGGEFRPPAETRTAAPQGTQGPAGGVRECGPLLQGPEPGPRGPLPGRGCRAAGASGREDILIRLARAGGGRSRRGGGAGERGCALPRAHSRLGRSCLGGRGWPRAPSIPPPPGSAS